MKVSENMIITIVKKKSGNCGCFWCGNTQPGLKMHPFSVYHKCENAKRGSYDPVCSEECGKMRAQQIRALAEL